MDSRILRFQIIPILLDTVSEDWWVQPKWQRYGEVQLLTNVDFDMFLSIKIIELYLF